MVLTTPNTISTLQRKLYTKAKQEPAYRFYALYDKAYREDVLSHAWRLVRANRGNPGVDGISFEAIESGEGVETFLRELAQDLKDKTYRAQPVRRVMILKDDGKSLRPLGIPTIRDRVAQMAVKLIIEPIFEADFCDHSYGFRPKRSAHDALDDIANALWAGYTQVIDADLSKYSPLLANCYLHLLDRIWQRHHLRGKLQAHLVRYADDFVVLCRRGVEEPLKVVRRVLERLGLNLNEAKTQVVDATEASFDFLGFSIRMSRGMRTGKTYPHVCPSAKSLMKIKTKLTALTGRELTPIALERIVGNVNRSLNGWVNYFHYRNSSQVMEKVKTHAEQRLRVHLMKRHKVKDRGIGEGRFPSVDLYRRYGLTKIPTAAGWRSAHASA
jgi:hypothetical protein